MQMLPPSAGSAANWVWLGEMTPIYVTVDASGGFVPLFWRDPLSPVLRSDWQPHHGFVCFEVSKTELPAYDEQFRPINVKAAAPLIFLEEGEMAYVFEKGAYRTFQV